MYNGELARKTTLVNFGFRLPSALDNRPQELCGISTDHRAKRCTSRPTGGIRDEGVRGRGEQ